MISIRAMGTVVIGEASVSGKKFKGPTCISCGRRHAAAQPCPVVRRQQSSVTRQHLAEAATALARANKNRKPVRPARGKEKPPNPDAKRSAMAERNKAAILSALRRHEQQKAELGPSTPHPRNAT